MSDNYLITHIQNLDWNTPEEDQREAITILSQLHDSEIELLSQMFRQSQKSMWSNAVKVVELLGFPRNSVFLPWLIELLQDINWPGALEAVDLLAAQEKAIVVPLVEDALHLADKDDDFMWLGGIRILCEKAGYCERDFEDKEVFRILEKAEF